MTGQDALPGLQLPPGPMAHIVTDVEATIAALTAAGHIKAEHQARVGLARAIATKLAEGGPAYGVAQLAAQLDNVLDKLAPADAATDTEAQEFAQLAAELREAEADERRRIAAAAGEASGP